MKRGLLVLAGIATALALASSPAAASPTHNDRISTDKATTAATAAAPLPTATVAAINRATILRIARSQLGYAEHGNNCTKYGPCEEWCSLFATWVWRKAGVRIPSYAFTGAVYRWGQRQHLAYGKSALGRAAPGDVLLFGTGPSNTHTSTHIGIVEKVAGRRVTLIEGNSANAVRRHSYTLSSHLFYGGVRP